MREKQHFTVEKDLLKRFKVKCAREGKKLSYVIEELIKGYLSTNTSKKGGGPK